MTSLENRPRTALLVVDMQNGVVGKAFERDRVIANIRTLVGRARAGDVPVVDEGVGERHTHGARAHDEERATALRAELEADAPAGASIASCPKSSRRASGQFGLGASTHGAAAMDG